jgi:hypothetical protein
MGRRIQLLQLHGSVTYFYDRWSLRYVKLERGSIEGHERWDALRGGDADLEPLVILDSQRDKAEHVEEFPYQLAYEMFAEGLRKSEHWLIIGYSFRDETVNRRLSSEFMERVPKPSVLVVAMGGSPSRAEIERALGWSKDDPSSEKWLTINQDGANGIETTSDWAGFTF